jgi:hypothetical protein
MSALLDKADKLQEKVQSVANLSDTTVAGHADSADLAAVDRFVEQQKRMVITLRANAATLASKAKEMAEKVREIENLAEQKTESADSLQEQAGKLRDLEGEKRSLLLQMENPFQIGVQHRFFFARVKAGKDFQGVIQGGLNFSYTILPFASIGLTDISLYVHNTHDSKDSIRLALCAAPSIAFFSFPIHTLQVGGGFSVMLQGQVGGAKAADVAVTPSGSLFSEAWLGNHFSFGPLFALHYQAHGAAYAVMIPSADDNSLGAGTWWSDAGIVFHYHF